MDRHAVTPTDKSCPWFGAVGHATETGRSSTTAFPHAGTTNVSHLEESRSEAGDLRMFSTASLEHKWLLSGTTFFLIKLCLKKVFEPKVHHSWLVLRDFGIVITD